MPRPRILISILATLAIGFSTLPALSSGTDAGKDAAADADSTKYRDRSPGHPKLLLHVGKTGLK